ncbi:acyloxyacyl hydrolase [Sphingomonas swuensis]|uniref:Acyloxyacyl hydrolase n=1 Tax=Sphingomonas swuensis TaxID=977800 RepID=A0ABP7TCV0_9SPHN
MRLLLGIALAVLVPASASASELFTGVHAHAVNTPLSLESDLEGGTDLSLGIRGDRIGRTPLQPYAFVSVNTAGDTNFAAAGLSARFGRQIYIRPGIGIAVHSGSAANSNRPDRIAFGSRVLFEPELAVGAALNDRLSLEASWVHFSHGQIFGKQNPGIDNIGVRLNLKL